MGEGRKRLRNVVILVAVFSIVMGTVVIEQDREDIAEETTVTDMETEEREVAAEPVLDRQCGSYCYEIQADDTVEITAYLGSETILYIPFYLEDRVVTSIGPGAFRKNKTVERIYIPQGITKIREEAFAGCTALRDIYISENVREIGERAMADCPLIEEIVFPKALNVIKAMTCQGDTGLKQITIQCEVSEVADEAFAGCEELRLVYGESEFAEEYAQEKGFVYVNMERIRKEGNLVW